MVHGGHIRHENYEFTSVGGPAFTSAFNRTLDLRYGDLDPTVYGRRTLKTALNGSILEYTYIGGPVTSLISNC